jgi:hypothetical protein
MDRNPVPVPMLTPLLVDAISEANKAQGKRPKAFDTYFRHSDAGKCARRIGFSYLGYDDSDPMDLSGHWVTWLGRILHEHWQEAGHRVLNMEAEVKVRHGDLSSGHLDALVTTKEGITICYELKTKGSFGFDKSMGYLRKSWTRIEPQGPPLGEILQGSLNALASGADLLIIGIMGLDSISKGNAKKMGVSDLDRIMGEWHYTRSEFEPLALAELERLGEIKGWLDADFLPPRWGLNDAGYSVTLDPDKDHDWQCVYCPYRSMCSYAGAAAVPLPIPGLREWMKESVNAVE